ncbi:hypothetical protein ABZ281_18585 [Streptomyces sp. NPDC006265]|uniref:hypothetical protein n=1 Tax=Streptomyces sp. NPDC006265 TaxID=3156740 RepID=UPI0033BAC631
MGPWHHAGLGHRPQPQDRHDHHHRHRSPLRTPTDIQAVKTWLYWSCGSSAGVYDRSAARKITVLADLGPARLADGFLLRENRTTHELLLTDFPTGTAFTRTRVELPTTDQNISGSNGRWAVDRSGGPVAYVNGTYGEVSIVPSGVPTSPLAQTPGRLTVRDQALPPGAGLAAEQALQLAPDPHQRLQRDRPHADRQFHSGARTSCSRAP